MRLFCVILAAAALSACNSKEQLGMCVMEAEKVYVVRPKSDDTYNDKLVYIAYCMKAHQYELNIDSPTCSKYPPSPQMNENCYENVAWDGVLELISGKKIPLSRKAP